MFEDCDLMLFVLIMLTSDTELRRLKSSLTNNVKKKARSASKAIVPKTMYDALLFPLFKIAAYKN